MLAFMVADLLPWFLSGYENRFGNKSVAVKLLLITSKAPDISSLVLLKSLQKSFAN
jgi:hypothetical protein